MKREKKKKQKREEYFLKKNGKKIKRYVCQFRECRNKLKGLTYKCPYCKKEHCEKHRLPERHKCKDPTCPAEMKNSTVISYSRGT